MKIDTILDLIDLGSMALPEFQRGYVWNREQVRGLMRSLYRRHPVGSLLVWATKTESAYARGDAALQPGVVKLLLDGQQRITSLYGIIKGQPPRFFDGSARAFTGLHFNLDEETFEFYAPTKMRDDPAWVDVTEVMRSGTNGTIQHLIDDPRMKPGIATYLTRLNALTGIRDVELHIDEVAGDDKTVDVVVDIFNAVNSGGTKLSTGDLALAKICAERPQARDEMKQCLSRWREAGFEFSLDWLLRNVNAVATGEARFSALAGIDAAAFGKALSEAEDACNHLLNVISGRLGLDHGRVLGGRYGFPVLARYLTQRGGKLKDAAEQGKLLYWYVHAFLWGHYAGSVETTMNQDLEAVEGPSGSLDRLIEQLKRGRGDLVVRPEHLSGASLGARFYPLLYLLTRVHGARDWESGLQVSASTLGKLSAMQVHHIFPKAVLYEHGYTRDKVNAIANFCFLTQESNLGIGKRPPVEYFGEVEAKHPGALASQWVPMGRELWEVGDYERFLAARRELLAESANEFLDSLLAGSVPQIEVPSVPPDRTVAAAPGGVASDEEEARLLALNDWVEQQGLPKGEQGYELVDEPTGQLLAVLDLAWPLGLQQELSNPVAVLIDEGDAALQIASQAGYTCFTDEPSFRKYVQDKILGEPPAEAESLGGMGAT